MPLDLHLNDVLVLKKPHPCGANRWRIYRLGADIGLKCEACGRLVLIPRSKLERRIRQIDRAGAVYKPGGLPPLEAHNGDS
jgi:hypothetical protein